MIRCFDAPDVDATYHPFPVVRSIAPESGGMIPRKAVSRRAYRRPESGVTIPRLAVPEGELPAYLGIAKRFLKIAKGFAG